MRQAGDRFLHVSGAPTRVGCSAHSASWERVLGWPGLMLEDVEPFAMMVVVRRRVRGRAMALKDLPVRIVLATLLGERTLVLSAPPARVTLRGILFALSGGPRVVLRPAHASERRCNRVSFTPPRT
jgi:hypothetical protein